MEAVTTADGIAGDAISVRRLTFAYAAAPVLKDVEFTLRPGAIGLLGPNGSGKTTLLRALLGHLPLPPGAVVVRGQDMGRDPRAARRGLGWMPERGGIIPGMSGVSMVAYLGELSGMPPRDALQRAHAAIDYVGLAEERYRPVETYSQGMRQRIKLAQALVHDPVWVLLDEPTSGLDPKGRSGMLELVRDLARRKGLGVILSTHLLPDVQAVCEEILVLREGRLLAHERVAAREGAARVFEVEGFGDEEAFLARLTAAGAAAVRDRRFFIVTLRDGQGAAPILAAAAATNFALRRVRRQTVTLEDVFFQRLEQEEK